QSRQAVAGGAVRAVTGGRLRQDRKKTSREAGRAGAGLPRPGAARLVGFPPGCTPMRGLVNSTYKVVRRIVVAVVGTTVLLLGVIMLVTPGPAFLVIPAGLAILGLEFAWARYWLRKARRTISSQAAKLRSNGVERRRGNGG